MKRFLLSVSLIFIAFTMRSADTYNFTSLDVKDGVPDNFIHEILRDEYGFMWFISGQVLTRYDGYDFKHYELPVPGWHAYYLLKEDKYHNIWVRTNECYFFYDKVADRLEDDLGELIDYPGVGSGFVFFDVDYDGNLWFSITEGELVYYRGKDDYQVFIYPAERDLEAIESRDGHALLLFSDGQVCTAESGTAQLVPFVTLPFSDDYYMKMYLDKDDMAWFFVPHSFHGNLISYDVKTKSFNEIRDNDGRVINFVTDVIDDDKGNLWISTDNSGIIVYDKLDGTSYKMVKDENEEYSIPSSHVECLYLDCQDIMWVGTSKRGIAYTCLNDVLFKKKNYPGVNEVSCVVEDRDGNIWYGTDGNGVVCDIKGSGKLVRYTSSNSDVPSNLIVCAFLDSKGRVWFGTYGSGVFYYENGRFVSLKTNDVQIDGHPMRDIRSIEEDAYGNIWIGTIAFGLFCYEADGSVSCYSSDNTDIYTNGITDLYCQQERMLYVATASGLFVIDTYTRKVTDITSTAMGITNHAEAVLNCVCRDSRGLLWCGTTDGMRVYNGTNGEICLLDRGSGLSHDYIKGICEDRNGNIWLTTDVGVTNVIVVYDPVAPMPKFRCLRYYDNDGLYEIMFYTQSITCLENGKVIMGGIGGLVETSPLQNPVMASWSNIQFTDLHISNQRVNVGEEVDGKVILESNIQTSDCIELDYSNNSFSISVSSLNFPALHKTHLMYRLEGHTDWINLKGNVISFNKLQPGTYDLQVKVADPESADSKTASLKIRIKPPVWQSTAAYILYVLILCTSVTFLIIRIRQKTKLKYKVRILDMNISHQKEMEEAHMRFFTNVSHDLRTPLSLIITPLERILGRQGIDSRMKTDLKHIHHNAELLMDAINQLLDFRKLDDGMSRLNLSHGNLTGLVKEVCKSFRPYSIKKKIRLNLNLTTEDIKLNFDKDKMRRIIVNLLSNAYKFNTENGTIDVTLDIATHEGMEMVRLAVADTGIGISDEGKTRVFERFYQESGLDENTGSGIGLNIVKEYVRMHGGSISVADNHPKGTVFTVMFPYENMAERNESQVDDDVVKSHCGEECKQPILIVEDNDSFRHFLAECLKERFAVVEASNGKEAMSMLEKMPVRMVISDVMMPKMNGLELCRAIKNDIRFSHIPVILLTAKTADDNILQGLKEGSDDYITKPFNLDILMLRIDKLLEWSQNNHVKFKTIDVSPSEITITSLDEQLISKAVRLVEENISNMEFSVDDLSSAIGMTRGHLYKKLMAITGKAPLDFIRTIRIKRGRQILEKSQLGVADVAYRVGLSPKQFSKYFKDAYGELPSEFRKRAACGNVSVEIP